VWLYQVLVEYFTQVQRPSLDVNAIMDENPDMDAKIEQVLATAQAQVSDLVFLAQGFLVGTVNAPYKSGEV